MWGIECVYYCNKTNELIVTYFRFYDGFYLLPSDLIAHHRNYEFIGEL